MLFGFTLRSLGVEDTPTLMIVIRRLVDRHRAYTGIFLPGEPARIFPTTEQEHSRIMQIYLQDRPHEGIVNDFSEYRLGGAPRRPR